MLECGIDIWLRNEEGLPKCAIEEVEHTVHVRRKMGELWFTTCGFRHPAPGEDRESSGEGM